MSEQDELLTWLQAQCDRLKKDIELVMNKDEDYILPQLLQGRLDAYRNVIAFIQTGGKLR